MTCVVTADAMATAPAEAAALPRRAWVQQVMGLPVSVHLRGPDADVVRGPRAQAAVAALYADLHEVDARFSTYRPDSEVSALRAGRLGRPSADLAEVQQLCEVARAMTGGAFDADLPGGWDPSGLVKGWAVERGAGHLRQLVRGPAGTGGDRDETGAGPSGELDWLVNAGGDVLVHAAAGRTWRVGVEDPADPARVLAVVETAGGAVATSGTAHRGAHITDPATGGPADDDLAAVTVVGPSLLWADVLATAAVVKGAGAQAWLDGLAGYRGRAWVRRAGTAASTG